MMILSVRADRCWYQRYTMENQRGRFGGVPVPTQIPPSSANGYQAGIPPKRPLRVQPSNVVGIQTTGRSMYRGYCWASTAAADANSIEADSRAQRQQQTKIEHGAGSLIKAGPQDTKGVCADDGETLRVRILSALQRYGYHLTAAPGDCDGWLRRARSHDSEHHPDKSACSGSGAVL